MKTKQNNEKLVTLGGNKNVDNSKQGFNVSRKETKYKGFNKLRKLALFKHASKE